MSSDGTVSESASGSEDGSTTEDIITTIIYNIENGDAPDGVTSYNELRDYLIRNGLPRSEVVKEINYWNSDKGKPNIFDTVNIQGRTIPRYKLNQYMSQYGISSDDPSIGIRK